MCEVIKNPAVRQFRRKCRIATALSLMTFILCSQGALRTSHAHLGILLAGIAGAAIFTELVSVGLLVTRLRDEFQQALLLKSFLWATLLTMAFTTVWGFMELHGRGQVPHLDVIWVPLILVCVTAIAKVLVFRQHRAVYE